MYDDASDSTEPASRICIEIDKDADAEEWDVQQVVDAISQSLGMSEIEYTADGCSMLIEGADIVIDIANTSTRVNVEISRSDSHEIEAPSVDKTELTKLNEYAWGIDETLYFSDSYANVRSLIDVGGAVPNALTNEDATACEIFSVTYQLQEAIASLADRSAYPSMPYTDVSRDPDAHLFESMSCSGRVLQVIESDDTIALRVATSGNYDDVVLVAYSPDLLGYRILEDDWITAYGWCLGLYSYKSTGAGTITIPELYAIGVILN